MLFNPLKPPSKKEIFPLGKPHMKRSTLCDCLLCVCTALNKEFTNIFFLVNFWWFGGFSSFQFKDKLGSWRIFPWNVKKYWRISIKLIFAYHIKLKQTDCISFIMQHSTRVYQINAKMSQTQIEIRNLHKFPVTFLHRKNIGIADGIHFNGHFLHSQYNYSIINSLTCLSLHPTNLTTLFNSKKTWSSLFKSIYEITVPRVCNWFFFSCKTCFPHFSPCHKKTAFLI